ncbi:hypothetical protein LTR08_006817 [Meristemomyces frigidus]|nr:hypothetical protein LTR08_006817 [Meristemomyces frigidus]
MDSAGRTLSGTPGQADVGASTFVLTAADDTGAAHMACTLVISADPAPQLEGDVSEQLAATANLSSTEPPVVTVLPSTDFYFNFKQSSFIDIVQRKLYYYATLTDHTPLPSWLVFDAQNMAFSGTAPLLSALPQSWEIDLIASDVVGFAGATASFTIEIGAHQLGFVPSEQNVNITSGTQLGFTSLQDQLYRNGRPVSPQSLSQAKASPLPHWMSFDPGNLAISGTVPVDVSDLSVTITVTDKLGDVASAIINFISGNTPLIVGIIGTLTAYPGQNFEYRLPDSLFTRPNPLLSVAVPTTATWLQFDSASRELHGIPPTEASPASITATLVAKPSRGATGQAQEFTIDIKAAASNPSSSSSLTSSTSSSTSTPLAAPAGASARRHLSAGIIATIVILSIIVVSLLIACLILCVRRRRRNGYERQSASSMKRKISRPMPVPGLNEIYVTTDLARDVEKLDEGGVHNSRSVWTDEPPQIALNLPRHSHTNSRKSKWLKRFSLLSQASSIGDGEDAIRADSNIPEWGADFGLPKASDQVDVDSIADSRSLEEKRKSFIRNRASTSLQSPLFAHGSRAPSIGAQNGHTPVAASSAGSARRSKRVRSTLTSYSESSSLEPQSHDPRRFSSRVRSVFAPNFPRAITRSSMGADDEGAEEESSGSWTTSSSVNNIDLAAEMVLPRHKRGWVLPGEASPTPPPAPPVSRQTSDGRYSMPLGEGGGARQRWKGRMKNRSSSPLSTAVVLPVDDSSTAYKSQARRRSRLSEPLSLVSSDSVNRARLERPRLVHTNSKRPVSVEEAKRLSSFKAETGTDPDTQAGGETWEDTEHDTDLEGSGLMPRVAQESKASTQRSHMSGPAFLKFGKHIQKRQLDIPEYAASFVDYKALKKLIKKLSATPILQARQAGAEGEPSQDPQAALQANKAAFFFRLDREIERVNTFYLQKEAELKLRLRTLSDKKVALQSRTTLASKLSSSYLTLDEGYRLFSNDLDKLQQFVEVNQTAFSKILKKWDKSSKSRTKELYLSRAVDIQPCFNRDVISDLSDQATTGLLELQAWAEGEKISYTPAVELENRVPAGGQDEEVETQVLQAVNAGDGNLVREWAARTMSSDEARERISKIFLNSVNTAHSDAQQVLYQTGVVDFNYADPINERNCIHEAAVSGKVEVLKAALAKGADVRAPDVYGRLPLHYACMHGRVEMIQRLAAAAPDTVDAKDLDNFTPLIHGIVHAQTGSVQAMLQLAAVMNPTGNNDHIPLNLACQYGTVAIVERMLRYEPKMLPDAEGLYPQHLVSRFGGDKAILVLLKSYGVDMDQPDKLYSWTPIFHAASEGHLHCLQQLLEFGVNAAAIDEKGLSAMYYAAWEGHLNCVQLLAHEGALSNAILIRRPMDHRMADNEPPPFSTSTPAISQPDSEMIPSLSLPPPIIPLRRYGHNFLDPTSTFILLSFDDLGNNAIEFYGDTKYPAARLTISSKSSDLIPRNVPLPVQDDFKNISFQIENLATFSIDFDIYPTFGSKVIARAAASSRVFTGKSSSSGQWHLELFDPRLRAIGRISFRFQVVAPFHGIPLEITHFATYWKATSQYENNPSNLITGSSLSGDFMRLFVQVTSDGVPVLFSKWALPSSRNDLVSRMTYGEFMDAGNETGGGEGRLPFPSHVIDREDLISTQRQVARSWSSLKDALAYIPPDIPLELHVCYPTRAQEDELQLGPTKNINMVVDNVLKVVFDHARYLREARDSPLRSFVFSSYNTDVCTALNWKQPNYPVLLCNELGAAPMTYEQAIDHSMVTNCGRASLSIKEAVRIAQSNNFMGLICESRLLDLVPALVSSIKEAGLVLISDYSRDIKHRRPSVLSLAQGVDGMLMENALLRFRDTIDQ